MTAQAQLAPTTWTEDERERKVAEARQYFALKDFAGFARYMWPIADPTVDPDRGPYWSWYLQLLCEELEGLVRGTAPDGTSYGQNGALVIAFPPGHGKSSLCNVLLPAWVHLHDPSFRFLTSGNKNDLASRDSRAHRDLLRSDEFRAIQAALAIRKGEASKDDQGVLRPMVRGKLDTTREWVPWGIAKGHGGKVNFDTSRGGRRVAVGINSGAIGKRCGGLIVDDPHDTLEVLRGSPSTIAARLQSECTTYHGSFKSRLNRTRYNWRLVVHQRLGRNDLAGDLIRRGVRSVVLPLHHPGDQSDRKPEDRLVLHPRDPRKAGELLDARVFSEDDFDEICDGMPPRHVLAQFEQYAPAAAGSTFTTGMFGQTYRGDPVELARRGTFDRIWQSLDCKFKEGSGSWVVLTTWGEVHPKPDLGPQALQTTQGLRPGSYLLDRDRGRWGLFDTCATLRRGRAKWKAVAPKQLQPALVEEAAAGADVIETMRREGIPCIAIRPRASKEARAEVFALELRAARAWFPEEQYAPWLGDYVNEHVDFPAEPNDQVDSSSQYFVHLKQDDTPTDLSSGFSWVRNL